MADDRYEDVTLLLPLNGSDGAVVAGSGLDYAHVPTSMTGNAVFSVASYKWGGSSAFCSGSTNFRTINLGAVPATSDFTFELWFNTPTFPGSTGGVFSTSGTNKLILTLSPTGDLVTHVEAGSVYSSSAATISAGSWYHIAIERQGDVFTTYINGAQASTLTTSGVSISSSVIWFGINAGNSSKVSGYYQDIRITTNGVRYGGVFISPVSAFDTTPLFVVNGNDVISTLVETSVLESRAFKELVKLSAMYMPNEVLSFFAQPTISSELGVASAVGIKLLSLVKLDELFVSEVNVDANESFALEGEVSLAVARSLTIVELCYAQAHDRLKTEVVTSLLELFVLSDVYANVADLTIEETAALADQLTQAIQARLTAPETLALQEELQSSIVATFSEAVNLEDVAIQSISTLVSLSDGVVFIGSLPLEDGDYQAWVMNADTTGVTTYSNFPMDSLWVDPTDGKPYGLNSTGIYRLEGTDDDGEPINAVIATGDIEFETSREKNVPRCYLYITQGGDAILKTITSVRGSRHETYYELADRTTDGDDDNTYRRVPLGRGVRGIWWRFEIHNVDGSTIDLSGAEVLPVVLSRRG